jgi:hypothetical protein
MRETDPEAPARDGPGDDAEFSDQPPQLLNFPRLQIEQSLKAAQRGDPEALAFWEGLWPEPGPCCVCGRLLAPLAAGSTILPDPPNAKRGLLMLGRQCDVCAALPTQVRMHRLNVLYKRMFPGFRSQRPAWNRYR